MSESPRESENEVEELEEEKEQSDGGQFKNILVDLI